MTQTTEVTRVISRATEEAQKRLDRRLLETGESEAFYVTVEDLLASLVQECDVGCAFARLNVQPDRVLEEYRAARR